LNQSVLLTGVIAGFAFQQPLFTTILFFITLGAVLFGKKGSLIYFIGSRIFAEKNRNAPTDDPRLIRFNNTIATLLLGFAQTAFLLHAPLAGWILSGMLGVATAVALSGFCLGCFLFYQFNLQRYKLFGQREENENGC
jgi:membrane associated rhomboid family serine protease